MLIYVTDVPDRSLLTFWDVINNYTATKHCAILITTGGRPGGLWMQVFWLYIICIIFVILFLCFSSLNIPRGLGRSLKRTHQKPKIHSYSLGGNAWQSLSCIMKWIVAFSLYIWVVTPYYTYLFAVMLQTTFWNKLEVWTQYFTRDTCNHKTGIIHYTIARENLNVR